METDATQDDFQDVDDAELENILSERDVLDIMKALDDDGKYGQLYYHHPHNYYYYYYYYLFSIFLYVLLCVLFCSVL